MIKKRRQMAIYDGTSLHISSELEPVEMRLNETKTALVFLRGLLNSFMRAYVMC